MPIQVGWNFRKGQVLRTSQLDVGGVLDHLSPQAELRALMKSPTLPASRKIPRASLQAAHTNDFVQVVQLRAALIKALRSTQGRTLAFDALGKAIFAAAVAAAPATCQRSPRSAAPHRA